MSDVSQALAIINGLEWAGIIERYAIGGAVGATFYLEPIATIDVDVFVVFLATVRQARALSATYL